MQKILNYFLAMDRIYKTEFFITSLKYQQKKMFRKNYTDTEIEERLNIFWIELEKQCNELIHKLIHNI